MGSESCGANYVFAIRQRHGPGGDRGTSHVGRHLIVLPGSDTISFSTSSPSNSMYSGKIASAAMSRGPRLSIGKGGSPRHYFALDNQCFLSPSRRAGRFPKRLWGYAGAMRRPSKAACQSGRTPPLRDRQDAGPQPAAGCSAGSQDEDFRAGRPGKRSGSGTLPAEVAMGSRRQGWQDAFWRPPDDSALPPEESASPFAQSQEQIIYRRSAIHGFSEMIMDKPRN